MKNGFRIYAPNSVGDSADGDNSKDKWHVCTVSEIPLTVLQQTLKSHTHEVGLTGITIPFWQQE